MQWFDWYAIAAVFFGIIGFGGFWVSAYFLGRAAGIRWTLKALEQVKSD